MNYVILYLFLMVHFCNIKISADIIRHKPNTNYDIDDFINRLLTSQKFDELADKVAEKAAKKIKGIDKMAPSRLDRFGEGNKNETLLPNYREKAPNTEYAKENVAYKNSNFRNVEAQAQTGKLGKIDTIAVMKKEATAQADRLKYKYLTRNAYEKKIFKERTPDNAEHNPVLRNHEKVGSLPNQNVMKESVAVQAHDAKVAGQGPNQEASDKKLNDPYKDGNSRYENREKEQRNHEKPRDTDGNRNQDGKMEQAREDVGPRRVPETENARLEFKTVTRTPESELEENIEEEELNSSPEVKKKEAGGNIESPSIEKTEEAKDANKSVEEQTGPMFRANDNDNSTEPDVEENKVTSDNNGNSDEDDITTKPPIIRREGNKLYAFMQGSDYEEYHEQFAKIEKEKGDEDTGAVF